MRLNLSMVHFKFLAMLESMEKRLALCLTLSDLKHEASFALMFLLIDDFAVYQASYRSKFDDLYDRVRVKEILTK
jgi:hypothetical protein